MHLLPCTCRKLADHTLHVQSREANEIYCNIQGFILAKHFSGDTSCDGKVMWTRKGNTHCFKLLLWQSKRYPSQVRLQVTSIIQCRRHDFYFEKDHRRSQLFLFSFGLLVDLFLNLGTTKLCEPDFLSIFLALGNLRLRSRNSSMQKVHKLE